MQVNQIRMDRFQLPDEQGGIDHVEIAVESKENGKPLADDPVEPGADIDLVFIFELQSETASAAAGIDLHAVFARFFCNIQHDVAGTGVIVAVDLDYRFHYEPLYHSLSGSLSCYNEKVS